MTRSVGLVALLRPLSTAEITNAVASQMPLSAQRHERPEILVSHGPFAKPLPQPPEEVRWAETSAYASSS